MCWVGIDSCRVKPSEKNRNAFFYLTFQSCFLPPSPSGTWFTVSMHAQNIHPPASSSHIPASVLVWASEKWTCSLMDICITFHCYEDCFESLLQERPFIASYSESFTFAAAWKGLFWVWKMKWDQKWDKSLVFLGIIWRQECHFHRNPIYFSLEQMTWLNIYLHNCSQMLNIERSTHKKVIW